ncbi:hypothetical protein EBU99_08305 [bacterium]|nr:hypothetical protein [bacterium]
MFEAVVFLAGPSRARPEEMSQLWNKWQPLNSEHLGQERLYVYIADAGLETFLPWFEKCSQAEKQRIHQIVWCGDGDSLGKHGQELLKNTAARFEGRWREHKYASDKDFSDCAAITSLMEYDIRHAQEGLHSVWVQVHGALGGRLDHELANILEFSESIARIPLPAAFLFGPEQVLTNLPLSGEFPIGQRFSVMSLQPSAHARVKISGARYKGEIELRQPSHGLSNVSEAARIEIIPLSRKHPLFCLLV